ncbi:MAG: hypothetical protein MJK18_02010, partial [Bdellovibrionales bacterium]|nr:hypothetical protein [Bdellovibrionales bacterium]
MDILHTADGSPTLSLSGGEKMHSMDGAFSESLFIYGSNVEKGLETKAPKVLSMGLGLGYNEIMSAAFFTSKDVKNFRLCSFESVPELRNYFSSWLRGEDSPLNGCYDEILKLFSDHYSI